MKVLYERMKAIQTDSDITIRKLASVFGVTEQSLGNYINGRHAVPYDVLAQFAKYFHVTTDYLLGLTDQPEEPFPVSANERTMLSHFRELEREQKEVIAQSIEFMREQNRRK